MINKGIVYKRKSLRLSGYNYSNPGAYFVTICTQEKKNLFDLPCVQNMIKLVWENLPYRFPILILGEFAILPNHIHAILWLKNTLDNNEETNLLYPDNKDRSTFPTVSLGQIIQAFKSITTHKYIIEVKKKNCMMFDRRLWQRNYFEHVIRTEKSLKRIREYIVNNPARWEFDRDNTKGKPDQQEKEFWQEYSL